MLVSYLFDPSLFKKKNISESGQKQQLELIVRNIFLNGTLHLDKNGSVKREIINNVKQLPTHLGQNVSILISELFKNRTFRIVEIQTGNGQDDDIIDILYNLLVVPTLDCFIWSDETRIAMYSKGIRSQKALLLNDYFSSDAEKLRGQFFGELPPIDTMQEKVLIDAISRAVRHSTKLKFFDKQIGKGSNTRHFRNGIKFILQIWKDTFSNQSQFLGCECIIYTCPLHEIRSDEIKSEVERKRKENRIFIEKVQRELVEPLSLEFKIPITLRVKEDRSGIFHARFLVSEKVSLSVERGFDLYSPSGTLHRNFIRIDNGCHSHIHQCESLPEMT